MIKCKVIYHIVLVLQFIYEKRKFQLLCLNWHLQEYILTGQFIKLMKYEHPYSSLDHFNGVIHSKNVSITNLSATLGTLPIFISWQKTALTRKKLFSLFSLQKVMFSCSSHDSKGHVLRVWYVFFLMFKHWFCWKYQYNKYTFNFIDHVHFYSCEWRRCHLYTCIINLLLWNQWVNILEPNLVRMIIRWLPSKFLFWNPQ
jgi:hypothetical protein